MIHGEYSVSIVRWSSLGYLCCRYACSIQLEESVIITGGEWSENRVQQYNLAGSMGRLPDLNTEREDHACGHYLHNGEVVSTNIGSVVILAMCVVEQVYIVTGGGDDSTETLTAGSSEWVEAGALPSARSYLSGVTIDNQFYVLGEW